ncbi:MAG: primosomal protein N' [Oscillospiraceae bacterium]|jgi:primosomal protein N' (replication factor Y)|nr:primosomal protein N' [Oscillospiraceae bacterium]
MSDTAPFLVAEIAVASARYHIDKPYDYRIPDSLANVVTRGLRVAVPFGRANKTTEAIVLAIKREESPRNIKCIESALEPSPSLTEEQLRLAIWMSQRFFCTLYDAIHACLPAGLWYREGRSPQTAKIVRYARLIISREDALEQAERKPRATTQASILRILAGVEGEMSLSDLMYQAGATTAVFKPLVAQGFIAIDEREVARRPKLADSPRQNVDYELNEQQTAALDALSPLLTSDNPEAALLYGVTGSGKTAVYLALIERTLALGKTAIALVPEIALTPQLLSLFYSKFGDDVAVMHSALTPGERYDEWRRVRDGTARVVVGTRSAVFAPLENIGLIVVDEEQEHTYKSESSPRYHAREVAKYRCSRSNGLLLLGSATPSVESMSRAESGVYKLVRLESRFNNRPLPRVILADMKEALRDGNNAPIGSILERELRLNIERGEQSIVFLNRRGANPVVTCVECGHTFTCPNCSVHLTYHSANNRLMCHYCGFSRPMESNCQECGGKLKFSGAGTQKVEEWLSENFPNVAVSRMDADTVSAANSHDKILSEFRDKRIPILLGTQMVAKGLDFENVTLVGVVSADMSLYVNDYRAYERTFSLLTQVVGRSGRGGTPGRAVIQTMTPEHSVILLASHQDYDEFYRREITRRRAQGMPPERDVICVSVVGEDEVRVLEFSARVRDTLIHDLGELASVLGPAPAVVAKVNNKYRYRVSVLCRNDSAIRQRIATVVRGFGLDPRTRGLTCSADVDPIE